jgi:hypothetical protein
VSKDSDQTEAAPRKFKLGPLGSLNQVTKGLAKTIRAMADGNSQSEPFGLTAPAHSPNVPPKERPSRISRPFPRLPPMIRTFAISVMLPVLAPLAQVEESGLRGGEAGGRGRLGTMSTRP